jgi:hypothetical protein
MTDFYLDSTLENVFLNPQLEPLQKKLFISHRSVIRIISGIRKLRDIRTDPKMKQIHLLRSLPHRHFWNLLPKTTLKLILDRNMRAFHKDFLKCKISTKSSI